MVRWIPAGDKSSSYDASGVKKGGDAKPAAPVDALGVMELYLKDYNHPMNLIKGTYTYEF
jgi:hypothetical protein